MNIKKGIISRFLIISFLLILSLTLVLAQSWDGYQNDGLGQASINGEIDTTDTLGFPNGWADGASVLLGTDDRQALIFDIDGDGVNDMVWGTGNFIGKVKQFITGDPAVFSDQSLPKFVNTGGSLLTQPDSVSIDGTNYYAAIINDGGSHKFIAYTMSDASTFVLGYIDTLTTMDTWNGVGCYDSLCYAAGQDPGGAVYLYEFDINSTTTTVSNPIGKSINGTTPISYYPFDDLTADDIVGPNDGDASDLVFDMVGGPDGSGSINFTATNPDPSNFNVSDDPTIQNIFAGGGAIEMWLAPETGMPNFIGLFDKSVPGTGALGYVAFLVNESAGGYQNYFCKRVSAGSQGCWQSVERIPVDTYSHYVLSFDTDSFAEDPIVYINGVQANMIEKSTPSGTYGSDVGHTLKFGIVAYGSSHYKGSMDEIKIYDENVSLSDAITAYNGGTPLKNPVEMALKPNGIPVVADLHADDDKGNLVTICDYDSDGSFGICVFDLDTLAFSEDFVQSPQNGVVDDLQTSGSGPTYFNDPIVGEVDGSPELEIILSYDVDGTCNIQPNENLQVVRQYDGFGASNWVQTVSTNNVAFPDTCQAGQNVYQAGNALVEANGAKYYCYYHSTSNPAAGIHQVICRDTLTGAVDDWINVAGTTTLQDIGTLGGASFLDLQSNNSYYIVGGTVYTYESGDLSVFTNFTSSEISLDRDVDATYHLAIGDTTGNGAPDFAFSSGTDNKIFTYNALTQNELPNLTTTIQYGGYSGDNYYNPVCVNTTISWQAFECGEHASCNYDNDLGTDTERLKTDCGLGGGDFNGDFNLDNPTVDCTYTSAGVYSVDIYLQDSAHQSDVSQVNSEPLVVTVIDGIEGTTCNILSTLIDSPDDQPDVVDSVVDDLDTGATSVSGGLNYMITLFIGPEGSDQRLFAGGFLVLLAIGLAGYHTKNGVAAIASGMVALVFTTFIGLIPAWIMIITIVGIGLIAMMGRFIGSGATA